MECFSITGQRHIAACVQNQDAICKKQSILGHAAALADGVSSCRCARAGAQQTVRVLAEILACYGDRLTSMTPQDAARCLIEHVSFHLQRLSEKEGKPVKEYASTMMGAFWQAGGDTLLTCNLGDGVILGVGEHGCKVLSCPANTADGCPATVTKNAATLTHVKVEDKSLFDYVVLLSDGAWPFLIEKNGKLRADICAWFQAGKTGMVADLLRDRNPEDDCSFVLLQRPSQKEKG